LVDAFVLSVLAVNAHLTVVLRFHRDLLLLAQLLIEPLVFVELVSFD
jgi:hypothetical protein